MNTTHSSYFTDQCTACHAVDPSNPHGSPQKGPFRLARRARAHCR
ncbi:cytochrome c3 family protein [Streptomyces sp. NPDC056503]